MEFSFLDAKSGNPYVPRAGYATRRYRYDDAGRSIGWSYLDDKGQPLDKQDDAAFHEYTRDARGRLMRVVYLDAAETPRAVAGRFCYERSLDGRGRLVRETNLDSEGNRMLDDSGYAIEETRYDGWDRVVEIRHLGIHEEPVDTSDGWSRKVMEYDEFGEKVSERRYDRLGNEVR